MHVLRSTCALIFELSFSNVLSFELRSGPNMARTRLNLKSSRDQVILKFVAKI
jgi:hypothetical protein